MEKDEQAKKEQTGAARQAPGQESEDQQKGNWRANLRSFFDQVRREDDAFADHVIEVEDFYARTARPALAEVARELSLYGRECETGEDAGRVFIIVRAVKEKVEFQYAVVAETRIEGITPYIHCWYEEPTKDQSPSGIDEQNGDQEDDAQSQDDDAQSQDERGGDQDDEGQEPKEGKEKGGEKKDDEKTGDDKSAAAPKRTKTIEPLANWTEGRALQSVTREEIISDFLAHYKDAVARLRASLHTAQKNQS